ncbi:unnamed protein product [Closterium sp. NIES-54]
MRSCNLQSDPRCTVVVQIPPSPTISQSPFTPPSLLPPFLLSLFLLLLPLPQTPCSCCPLSACTRATCNRTRAAPWWCRSRAEAALPTPYPSFPSNPPLPDPVFLLSPLGMHSRNLQSDPR